jgi:N-acetylglucosamine kinase-like BadF-type ATPase
MILLADSGSTKCDWILLDNWETRVECNSIGFNPFFHDSDAIVLALRNKTELMTYAEQVKNLYFYGAGCSNEGLKKVVANALKRLFPLAEVHVSHDLDGAALATYQGEPHIAGILGTGSNSCFYDGEKISEVVPALAYILGDESSGSYYGKRLLADFLYRRMPEHLAKDFANTYDVAKDVIMTNVYMRPHANVYLASFMRFCSQHREDPYITSMIRKGLRDYLETHVACYPNHKEVPVNFVGSVAYYFEPVLREVAGEMGIRIGKVVKKPILGLVDYHREFTFSGVSPG